MSSHDARQGRAGSPGAERHASSRRSSRRLRTYLEAGFSLTGTPQPVEAARALPTTWAKKLGFSGKIRAFWEFQDRVVGPYWPKTRRSRR